MSYLQLQLLGIVPSSCHWCCSLSWGDGFRFPHGWRLHLLVSPPSPPWKVGLHQLMPLWSKTMFGLGWQVISAYPCKQPISLPPNVTYQDEFTFYLLYILLTNEVLTFTLRCSNLHTLVFKHRDIISILFLNQRLSFLWGWGEGEEGSKDSM